MNKQADSGGQAHKSLTDYWTLTIAIDSSLRTNDGSSRNLCLSGSVPSSRSAGSCRSVRRLAATLKTTNQPWAFDVRLHSNSPLTADSYFPSRPFIPSHSHFALQLSSLLALSSPSAEPDLFHIPFAQVRGLRQTYLTSALQAGRWMWQLWKRGWCGPLYHRRVNPGEGVSRWARFEAVHPWFP